MKITRTVNNLIDHSTWNEVIAVRAGDFVKLPAGGYICITKNVETGKSQNGNDMLTLYLDVAEGQFAKHFENAQYPPKYRQVIFGKDSKLSAAYKAMLEDYAKSNSGLKVDISPFDERTLINKKIGVVFGEREYLYNGVKRVAVEPKKILSVEDVRNGKFTVPERELLKEQPKSNVAPKVDDDFIGEEIPDYAVPFK